MAQLPTPGADNDTWGAELNTYLGVSHGTGGYPLKIADTTLGSNGATLSLTGLTLGGWTLVRLILSARSTSGATGSSNEWERAMLRFNGDTGANYFWEVLNSDSTHVNNNTAGYANGIEFGHMPGSAFNSSAWGFNIGDIYLPGDANRFKNVLLQTNLPYSQGSDALGTTGAGYWASGAPITEIDIICNEGGNMLTGSRAFLIGLA